MENLERESRGRERVSRGWRRKGESAEALR